MDDVYDGVCVVVIFASAAFLWVVAVIVLSLNPGSAGTNFYLRVWFQDNSKIIEH